MGIGIERAAADAVMIARFVEGVSIEVTLIEIEVTSVFYSESGPACQYEWEVGVTVAVPIGHAASKKRHGGVEE